MNKKETYDSGRESSIVSKFHPPRLGKVIHRQRLFNLLRKASHHPFIWIGAPAGYGKTTLVASFFEKDEVPHLWYRINADDENPVEFLNLLLSCAKYHFPKECGEIPSLSTPLPIDSQHFLSRLLAALPKPLMIVLDQFSSLSDDAKVHTLLSHISELIPVGINLVFISNHTPPPAYARALANQCLVQLTAEELRLTYNETARLVRLHVGGSSGPASIQEIHSQGQGWAAGVILMLKSGVHTHKLQAPSMSGENLEALFDYFAHEVFNQLDPVNRSLLLHASTLEHIKPPALALIAEEPRAANLLKALERKGCFLRRNSLGDNYQLHPLFRRFLFSLAQKTLTADQWQEIHRRAAQYYVSEGSMSSALECLWEAGEYEQALQLINNQATYFSAGNHCKLLQNQLTKFPSHWQQTSPCLAYWQALSQRHEQPATALDHLERAFHLHKQMADHTGTARSCTAAIDTIMQHLGMLEWLPLWLERLHQIIDSNEDISEELEAEIHLNLFQGYLFHNPDVPDFPAWAMKLDRLLHDSHFTHLWCQICQVFLLYDYWRGHFAQANIWLERLQMMCSEAGNPPALEILCHSFSATLSWHHHLNVTDTLAHIEKGLTTIEDNSLKWPKAALYSNLTSAHLSQGQLKEAREALETYRTFVRPDNHLDLFLLHHQATLIALLGKDLEAALAHVQETVHLGLKSGIVFHRGIACLDTTRVALALDNLDSAEKSLQQAETVARIMGSDLLAYESSLLRTGLHFKRREMDHFRQSLHHTLKLGNRHGFLTFMLWEPDCMTKLFFEALEMNLESDFVQRIIHAHKLVPPAKTVVAECWPWQIRIHTLGQFILESKGRVLSKGLGSKPVSLLKALILCGSQNVNVTHLEEILWPDADGDAAHDSFKVTLRRLRKLLQLPEALILKHNHLSLNPKICWTDVDTFRNLLQQAKQSDGEERITLLKKAFDLYQGPFLDQDDRLPATKMRESLFNPYQQLTLELGSHYEETEPDRAIQLYEKSLDVHDSMEIIYQHLITCHLKSGHQGEALATYQRCCRSLQQSGLQPSKHTHLLVEDKP